MLVNVRLGIVDSLIQKATRLWKRIGGTRLILVTLVLFGEKIRERVHFNFFY